MIPQEKLAAVSRGLGEAFGVTEFEDIHKMARGHNLVFRIAVRGVPYLLRIITNTKSAIGPERQFGCMKAAAEAGLAPRVWYTSLQDQISITDFVEEVPFSREEALVRMPAMLRALHALPPFPQVVTDFNTTCMFLLSKGPAVEGFMQKFQAANVLPQREMQELFRWRDQLAAAYSPEDEDFVPSHNDLFKPDNILFDGHRVWLVDWEAAFLNDRYADLAVVANLLVHNEAEERISLREYFGEPPSEYQLARLFLMRQLAHVFYTMAFLLMGSPVEQKAPDAVDFQRRMWRGEFDLSEKQTKTLFGRFHWAQLAENMGQERWGAALRTVSAHVRSPAAAAHLASKDRAGCEGGLWLPEP